jgi:hypothetical protein
LYRSIEEICTRALRRIGAFSINDASPEKGDLEEARHWLDLHVGHLAGTTRLEWLRPVSFSIPLLSGEQSYSLRPTNLSSQTAQSLLSQGLDAIRVNSVPSDGMQFPVAAMLKQGDNESELTILRRHEWDAITNKAQTGSPTVIFIDHTMEPILYVHPIPTSDDFSIELSVVTFHPDLAKVKPERKPVLRQSWGLWAVTVTALACGRGPVRRLPAQEIDSLEKEAKGYQTELIAFENDDAALGRPRRTVYNDLG